MALYCLDTSVFINGWTKNYPPDVFQGVWDAIDRLIDTNCVSCPREVLEEIRKKTDELCVWAEARECVFFEHSEAVQRACRFILANPSYRGLVNAKKGRSMGDPWVIAHAQVHGATVVAEEINSRSNKKPKIPDVCRALHIPCIRTVDLLKNIGFRA